MNALDQLERSLARAVSAGAAADPSAAPTTADSAAGERTTSRRVYGRRSWRRRGWHVPVVVILAGAATTGALAATGVLPIVNSPDQFQGIVHRDSGPGVPTSPARVLSLRVADPLGGPPWAIRTFATNRHAVCAQVGQLYGGVLGQATTNAQGRRVFDRTAELPGANSRCSSSIVNGLPVLGGLRTMEFVTTPDSPSFCAANPVQIGCTIERAYVVRWGLLGPSARSARLVGVIGTAPVQRLAARDGGAYILISRVDPRPFNADNASQAQIRTQVARAFPQRGPQPMNALEAKLKFQEKLSRAADAKLARAGLSMLAVNDAVLATFGNGATTRVAGHGARGGVLPGVPRVALGLPRSMTEPLHAEFEPGDKVVISFRSPVSMNKYAVSYDVQVVGPLAPACGAAQRRARTILSGPWLAGQLVHISVRSPMAHGKLLGWCPGRPYALTVHYHAGTYPGGHQRLIGQRTLIAP